LSTRLQNRIKYINNNSFIFTFFDVVDVIQTLQMLVSFAMQLEIGLQIGLVIAQLAD
jgi:hypothetical protein